MSILDIRPTNEYWNMKKRIAKNAQSKHAHRDYHAKLTIHGLPTMKSVTYRRLVNWLEATVKEMKKAEQGDYADTFTKRLMK
jgi:hypothetical protein